MKIRIACLFVLAVAAHDAHALDPAERATFGIGAEDSCASYMVALSGRKPAEAVAHTQWLAGFVSAINAFSRPGKGQIQVDVNGIALWVKAYCDTHPSEKLLVAASAFARAHRPTQLTGSDGGTIEPGSTGKAWWITWAM